jgi:anti-sigma B factor antagonist
VRLESIKLETAVSEISGLPVLKVAGEIDVYTAPEFKSAINAVIESGHKDLIVDLTDVSYMDSGGFGALLGATKRMRPRGGGINLVGCSEAIERMLRITRLDTIFGVFCEVDDAVRAFQAKP